MLTIKDLIRRARQEIEAAAQERISANQKPLLLVESVTIEINVVASEKAEGSGGFDLHVVTAGGSKSFETQEVQKIVVTLRTLTTAEQRSGLFVGAALAAAPAQDSAPTAAIPGSR